MTSLSAARNGNTLGSEEKNAVCVQFRCKIICIVSTESQVDYLIEACTIGLDHRALKCLVGVWTDHLYIQQYIKKEVGIHVKKW